MDDGPYCHHAGASGEEMSAGPDAANSNVEPRRAKVQRMMRRLASFARGVGLDEAVTLKIIRQVAADMSSRMDDERLIEARMRMIAAAMAG